MILREVMTTEVATVDADTSIREAAKIMARHDTGFLPVEKDGKLRGAITDRDIVVRALANDADPDSLTVADAMTEKTHALHDTSSVAEAGKLMADLQIRRLLVANEDGGVVGVVSLGDLALKNDNEELAGAVMEKVCEPAAAS